MRNVDVINVIQLSDRLLLVHWAATHVLTVAFDSEERISPGDSLVILFGKSRTCNLNFLFHHFTLTLYFNNKREI